ncbi:MAG: GNAT family N-acetyltransferase [Acidobacteriaceae bacterium]|nr:GNAT family N-acetyltransferase [Acidobacteriaceae bacterium]
MAKIRAQTAGTESFWADRIDRYLRGEHSPQQALQDRAAFVAVDEAKVVGFVAGHRTRRFNCDGELQWIDVLREKRGRGIGQRLIAQMGTWFVSENMKRICVNVASDNVLTRKLYTKCGAQPLSEHWMIWNDSHLICPPSGA